MIGSEKFPVRFSYEHVFEAVAIEEGQTKKFSVSLIISKNDTETLEKIRAAVKAAAEAGKGVFKNAKVPTVYKQPLRDGDAERPDDENYANSFFLNASSTRKPGVVDENVQAIIDPEEFYSGCFGRATVNFYAFKPQGGGVAAGLQNLQKLKDGDRLSGGASAASDFGSDDDLM